MKPLQPTVHCDDLGGVKLWRDELAEIVRMLDLLGDSQIRIEANQNLIEDLEEDLPKLGDRLEYFDVRAFTVAKRTFGQGEDEVLLTTEDELVRIQLGPRGSKIIATNPSLDVLGLIPQLAGMAKRGQRQRLMGYIAGISAILLLSLLVVPLMMLYFNAWTILMTACYGIIALVVGARSGTFFLLKKPVLYTATSKEVPPFWKLHRDEIIINVVVAAVSGVVFFLLGRLARQ